MVDLVRQVRFSLAPGADEPVRNSWGGWPSASQLAPYLTVCCRLTGLVDPVTGYLINVKEVDREVRDRFIARVIDGWHSMTAEQLTVFAYKQLASAFPTVRLSEVTLSPTPLLKFTVHADDDTMLQLTHQFEFSASHRLHNPDLTDEENLTLYGKCNNPHGHGHNYVVEVTIGGQPDPKSGSLFPIDRLDEIVGTEVIDPLDHKYLNIEVEEFQQLNSSVENIAVVVWKRLAGKFGAAKLLRVRIYETPKTWAEYTGP